MDISKRKRARQPEIVNNEAEKENWRPCREVEEPQSLKRNQVKQQRHGRLSVQKGSIPNVLPDVCITCKKKNILYQRQGMFCKRILFFSV